MQRDRSELVSMSLQNGWTRKFFLFLSLSLSLGTDRMASVWNMEKKKKRKKNQEKKNEKKKSWRNW